MTPGARQSVFWISVALLGLAMAVFLLRPVHRDMKLTLPLPESPVEPLQTHYIGPAALDLPVTFKLDSLKVIFYHLDPSDPTATITVSELAGTSRSKNWDSYDFERVENQLEKVDLSSKFKRPAQLVAHFKDKDVSGQNLKPSSEVKATYPNPVELEIILKTDEPWGHMEYRYSRILDQSETKKTGGWWRIGLTVLVERALAISAAYQWTGRNKPPSASGLALRYGQIVGFIDDGGPGWKVDCQANFTLLDDEFKFFFDDPRLTIVIEGFNDRPEKATAVTRTVGGHPGTEGRDWAGLPRNTLEWLLQHPKIYALRLSWQDGFGQEPTSLRPNFQAGFSYFSTTRNTKKVAKFLGMWETALNSIRLSAPELSINQHVGQASLPEAEAAGQ